MRAVAYLFIVISLVLAWAVVAQLPRVAAGGSDNLVISQVYGGGGNTGAPYNSKFVELFNRGASAATLAGHSIQYASATGTTHFAANPVVALPSVSVPPGGYFLVRLAGGATGADLPTPDATGTTNPAASAGKVILASTSAGLACNGASTPCSEAQLALIVDLVGYGGANFFEGSAAAPTLSNTTAALRRDGGCTDTDDNAADFLAASPTPRNSSAPLNPCFEPEPTPDPTPEPTPEPTPALFTFDGFLAPLANPPAVNMAKAGSSVVLHFSLGGDHGLDVIAEGYPRSQRRPCTEGEGDAVELANTPGKSGLDYDPLTSTYTYAWKTERSWAGTCRRLVLELVDGTSHHADFAFR